MRKSLTHGQDAGANAAVIRTAVAEYGTLDGIHNEPDISFIATDLDVGLISSEIPGRLVVVVIYERLDEHGGGLAIIGNLLMRDPDAVDVP